MNRLTGVYILIAAILTGCASAPDSKKPSASIRRAEVVRAEPESPAAPRSEPPAGNVTGKIIGRPMQESKFSQLKIGMTLKQVEKLIGPPAKQTRRSVRPHSARKHILYSYPGEGVLTFQADGRQQLVQILVNLIE